MAIRLEKGQRINLEKIMEQNSPTFVLGVIGELLLLKNRLLRIWNKKEELDVDVDLSCVMTDSNGKLVDTLYSPLYKKSFSKPQDFP